MQSLDDAQLTFLTAAAKVYAALKIANPVGDYHSDWTLMLDIDGAQFPCRCDCTGVIQCIIRVMGYDPNWGCPPGGDGLFLTYATEPFVKDKNGSISQDWVVLPFDPNDARPGDIRAAKYPHSHCDIFVNYKGEYAYGLNAGSGPNTHGRAIPLSCDAGVKFLQDNNPDDLVATWTIQDAEAATVLRYVNGSGAGGSVITSTSQTLTSLDVELAFIQNIEFEYLIQGPSNYDRVNPGFFPVNACYPNDNGVPATDSYGDEWLEFVPSYTLAYVVDDTEWINLIQDGLIMLYTLDNSDPLLYGKTVLTKDDGTNDYEASKGLVPIIRTQFPVHFRCVVVDDATHSRELGRSSAYFTNQSAEDCNQSSEAVVKAFNNSTFLTDAAGKNLDSPDLHGHLFVNDTDPYDRSGYIEWVKGVDRDA